MKLWEVHWGMWLCVVLAETAEDAIARAKALGADEGVDDEYAERRHEWEAEEARLGDAIVVGWS